MPRDLESLLRDRMADGFSPIDSDTVADHVRSEVGERSPSLSPVRPFARRALRVLAIAAALALVITAVAFGVRWVGNTRILQSAAAAVADGGVLHYKVRTSDGGGPQAEVERWVDVGRGIARESSGVTALPGETSTSLQRGGWTRHVTRKPNGGAYVFESESPTPFRDEVADEVAKYRQAIQSGDASVVRRETVGGIDTWRIETTERVWPSEAPAPDPEPTRVVANVSTRDFFPVRIAEGGGGGAGEWLREFTLFERLDERSVPATLFELPVPDGAPVSRQRVMRAAEVAIFKDLRVWWLGTEWEGLRLGEVGYYEGSFAAERMQNPQTPAPPMGWPDPHRSASLTYGGDNGLISITVMPRVDDSLWWWFGQTVVGQPPARGHWVQLGSTRALLFEPQGFPPKLVFERGVETILIEAANVEDPLPLAERAAQALRPAR